MNSKKTDKYLLDAHQDWVKAKGVIETFLMENCREICSSRLDALSSSLIARLSHADLKVERYGKDYK